MTKSGSEQTDDKMEKVWVAPRRIEELFEKSGGNAWGKINAPTAGARDLHDPAPAPVPNKDLVLYSLGTPNGLKVAIVLEELGLDYNYHRIDISKGDQFKKFFVDVNPNSKIPAMIDRNGPGGAPVRLFESIAIAMYLVEKEQKFFFENDPASKLEATNWLIWQVGSQGFPIGNFGHFFVYAPKDAADARDYGVSRYGMEALRLCDVLEKHLHEGKKTYLVGETYSVADMICFPWVWQLLQGSYVQPDGLTAAEFLGIREKFPTMCEWAERIATRPAVQAAIDRASKPDL
ncbi:Disulfide-bond oxidoreductase YghU [Porphyridium purpureum]|uniref:Disulfide-bond oxidoreductase YghU n=1 Tax=Porphyridium purpureum TaxID=35688 RepID=A0A5J4YYL4_PORPP|nr:Disulfide-bond oxidoreductase YghU [Porphyridium purpureum]|eukprot:POR9596..scf209_3